MYFFFLFKFSPFRHYLLEKIKSTKNVLFSVEEKENKLLLYTSYSDSKIMDERDYNIGYYSVRNL